MLAEYSQRPRPHVGHKTEFTFESTDFGEGELRYKVLPTLISMRVS